VLRALILLAALVAVGCGQTPPRSGRPAGPDFGFARAAGWYTDGTGIHPPEPQVPIVRAATVPLSDERGSVPWGTVERLTPDGIVIVVSAWRPYGEGLDGFPPRDLPLQLADASVQTGWEGQPNPDAPRYVIMAAVNGYWVEADVIFGTQHPGDDAAGQAQKELARLRLPIAPNAR